MSAPPASPSANGSMPPVSVRGFYNQSRSTSFKNSFAGGTAENAPFNFTPASTPSRSSFSTTSSPLLEAEKSMPGSPNGHGDLAAEFLELNYPMTSLNLNMPATPPVSQPTSPPPQPRSMSEASSLMKGSTLIRRLSRGATSASHKLRGRPSSASLRRDQHNGSVVRRRSDSRGVIDGSYDVSEVEFDPDEDDDTKPRSDSTSHPTNNKPQPPSRRSSDRRFAVAPCLPETTPFVRRSTKGTKSLNLSLDQSRCKITWTTFYSDSKIPDRRKQVYLDDIRSIRSGYAATFNMAEVHVTEDEVSRLITIVYFDAKTKFMHLVAPTQQQRDVWVEALNYLIESRATNISGVMERDLKTLKEHWRKEMANKFNADSTSEPGMDFDMILKTCRSFHINKSKQGLKQMFDALDIEKTGTITFKQYLEFFRQLAESSILQTVFEQLAKPADGVLTLEAFMNFLNTDQRIDIIAEWSHWEDVFNRRKNLPRAEDEEKVGMSFDAFRLFLNSRDNSALVRPAKRPLDQPLNEYFISSSHNTYLMGRQFNGQSSVEGYIEALTRGCRCIEIDCWDGPDGKPIVTHGRTLTSSVAFSDCVKAINKHAFVASEYPLIISLEVHCCALQQETMAQMMKQHFGSKLVLQTLPSHRFVLPSPEDLKNRILIKVKRPKLDMPQPPPLSRPIAHRRERSVSAPNPQTTPFDVGVIQNSAQQLRLNVQTPAFVAGAIVSPQMQSREEPSASDSEEGEVDQIETQDPAPPAKKQRTSNIIPVLGDMAVYTRGVRFSDWRSTDSRLFNHIYSFKESTFDQRSETAETKALMQAHNARYLMRVYPKFSRIGSSNFDPIRFWRRGVQMVATNWQTRDVPSEINDAMFATDNDRSGYVLKPAELRDYSGSGSSGISVKLPKKQVKFSVRIISAQHLGSNSGHIVPENPYVEFEVYSAEDKSRGAATSVGGTDASKKSGFSGLGAPLRKRTNIIPGNGYDPVWDQTIDMTLITKYPSLVFVRWAVHHSSDGRSANSKSPVVVFTAKLSSLAQGYRYIPLHNKNGDETISKLLCFITKEEPLDIDEPLSNGPIIDSRRSADDGPRKRDKMFGLFRTMSGRGVRPAEKETEPS